MSHLENAGCENDQVSKWLIYCESVSATEKPAHTLVSQYYDFQMYRTNIEKFFKLIFYINLAFPHCKCSAYISHTFFQLDKCRGKPGYLSEDG